ncbi:MAG: hypothetical protein ACLPKI_31480 [Streptosporangiaceae bacterium]
MDSGWAGWAWNKTLSITDSRFAVSPADAVRPFDRDQVALDGVHDPVPASAQPEHLSPPERLGRVRIGGQGI